MGPRRTRRPNFGSMFWWYFIASSVAWRPSFGKKGHMCRWSLYLRKVLTGPLFNDKSRLFALLPVWILLQALHAVSVPSSTLARTYLVGSIQIKGVWSGRRHENFATYPMRMDRCVFVCMADSKRPPKFFFERRGLKEKPTSFPGSFPLASPFHLSPARKTHHGGLRV